MFTKRIFLIIMLLIITLFSTINIYAEKSSTARRVYITNLEKMDGISSSITDTISDNIKITMLEKPGNEYRIISDDDIKVMFKKAESLQAAGCDDESCNLNIAQAIKADEIIYGTVSRDAGKIRVIVYNLETGTVKKQRGAGTKSMVNVSFEENELEWMSREIALKLINPKYKIVKAPVFEGRISISPVKIAPVKIDEISAIKFTNDETSLNAILDYYRKIADKGDILFSKNEYEDAREEYLEILKSIQSKMTDENQRKIEPFTRTIEKRVSSTLTMEYIPDIEKADRSILSESDPSEDDYREALKKYNKIEQNVRSEVDGVKGELNLRTEIQNVIDDRQDVMISAIISMIEKKADIDYRNYKFDEAVNKYTEAKRMSVTLNSIQLSNKTGEALDKKIESAFSTGRSYLDNIVNSHIDQAEYYNVINKPDKAKKSMDRARKKITGPLRIFASEDIIYKYNDFSLMIPDAKQIGDKKENYVQPTINQPERDTSEMKSCINESLFILFVTALGTLLAFAL